MQRKYLKPLCLIGCLIAVTCAAMAYSAKVNGSAGDPPVPQDIVTLSGQLTQHKIFSGGDGKVAMSITLRAADFPDSDTKSDRHVDMVIVLDRSGSMKGDKIEKARQAVLNLLSTLSVMDRIALIGYSDSVQKYALLDHVTLENRQRLTAIINRILAGGGTNLGAGLGEGIDTLLAASRNGNSARIILISDGLANKGITSPIALGDMASVAIEKAFAVSTVGVGTDFNEQLMTTIADRGSGRYYYLENPEAFAAVFDKEMHNTRNTVANALEIQIPLTEGMSLIDASGFPIMVKNGRAIFYPGDLRSGQTRKLFLTFRLPTDQEASFNIKGITASYRYNEQSYSTELAQTFTIACVKDKVEALSSVDKREWEQKVLQDDYNRLRENVARDIKTGRKEEALDRIEKYYTEKQAVNSIIGSGQVAGNLAKDVEALRDIVQETFAGKPGAVSLKQKKNAKSLQYESYKGRRLQK